MLNLDKKKKVQYGFILLIAILVIGVGVSYLLMNQASSKQIVITAEQYKFTPGIITFNKGDEVTLKIKSLDVEHGFYIDGYEIERILPALVTVTITFTADTTGTFKIRCSVTCGNFHPYMLGQLKVQPNLLFYSGLLSVGVLASVMTIRSGNTEEEIEGRGFVDLGQLTK